MSAAEADPDALAARLLDETAVLAIELARGATLRPRPGATARLSGVPVAGVFQQAAGERLRHRAGRPSQAVLRLAEAAADAARAELAPAREEDLPALLPLALAAFYVVEARRSGALGLGEAARGAPRATLLAAADAHRDPSLPQGASLLRIWALTEPDGELCVELRFASP